MDVEKRSDFEYYVSMMDMVYQFVLYNMDDYSQPRDYGTGDVLNMVEIHTLALIAETPGLCVSDVAKMWHRTLSAASRNVNRLHQKGLITKKKIPGNDKNVHLYPTEKGAELARLHNDYDRKQIAKTMKYLLLRHTDEELRHFNEVIKTCVERFEDTKFQGKDIRTEDV